MVISEEREVKLYHFKKFFKDAEITHFITSRQGGVSPAPYLSLNIGYGTGDFSLNVLENRHRLSKAIDIPLDNIVMCNQVHGTHVEVVTKNHKGKGALYRDNALLNTDAMVTNVPEICLFVMSADCVPLLFYDPIKKVIGAAHAGWRGTVKKIALETLKKMSEIYGSNVSDVNVGIGPSIGPCCYHVGAEVITEVMQSFGTTEKYIQFSHSDSTAILDLWNTNKFQLMDAGVKEENIEIAGICTCCNQDDFFSSRAGKGITGRFGAGIMLRY
jgi:YfiH family protein